MCGLSKLAKLSLIWFSQCFFTDYPEYPEFCVSHSREKSKEGAMAVFLLSASDVQVTHSQSCATLLPAFARAASPWSVVPGLHPDSLIFCSSEAWSTHTGWFPYHFSVAIMNPHEVLVFCSPKASDYGTECWEDWTPAHFGSSYSVFLCYQFYPWYKCSSEFCLSSLNSLFCQGSTVWVFLAWSWYADYLVRVSTLLPAAISFFANGVFVCVLCRLRCHSFNRRPCLARP